ncbi:MAG: DNA topology modulation protein FlaR [Clostridiaceae bacterium]|nr:DNA topology modulation protein FlaR [Clostridiaceae bacterium]
MKIHIIGGSGTGKSYIANKISEKYNIPHTDLDDIFWDNSSDSYGTKAPLDERLKKLNKILDENDNWVIEGVYYEWLKDSFNAADLIFVLDISPITFNRRIVLRFIKRKLGIQKGKKETFNSLKNLLKWTNNYSKYELPKILNFLKPYNEKVILIDNGKEIWEHLQ